MFTTTITLALVPLCIVAAGYDIKTRRIPNSLSLLILLSGVAYLATLDGWYEIFYHVSHFALALIAGMFLFKLQVWGGGDAKFYSAAAIWFPLAQAPLLAMVTALAGGIVVLVWGAWATFTRRKGWSRNLPYGVAIATGVLVLFLENLVAWL